MNLSACPDHYALRLLGGRRLEVIETCGFSPVPVRFFIACGDESGLRTPRDSTYGQQSTGAARFGDGTLIGGVRHQFKDTPQGFRARLLVEFPIITPSFIVKSHQMHLACEFSHWFGWIKKFLPRP